MQPQPVFHDWDDEDLLKTIFVALDEQKFAPLQLKWFKKRLTKAMKQGRLKKMGWRESWQFRLCSAALMRHQYHWTGWEYRSEWAASMVEEGWCWPRWDGTPCRLLVVAEQGLGDEILWGSCYKELLKDNPDTTVEIEPRLESIFSRSFPGIKLVNRFKNPETREAPKKWEDYPGFHSSRGLEFDAFIPAGQVPKLYRRAPEHFADHNGQYLEADCARFGELSAWLEELGQGPKVGIAWKGRQGDVSSADLVREIERRGAIPVSLQYFSAQLPHGVIAPPIDVTTDIEGVLALCEALDSVVTVPNTVAHIAGAVGCPTAVIKPPPMYAGSDPNNPRVHNRIQWQFPPGQSDWYSGVYTYRSIAEWRARR